VHYTNSRSTPPDYEGGIKAFLSYVGNSVVYPDYERANNIQGRVILSFIVEANGKTSNIKVLNSVSKNIDKEAVRVIKDSPNWIPGTQYGRKVRTSYAIPLNFTLTN
jgi:TonB family protein